MKELLRDTADRATRYAEGVDSRRVAPRAEEIARLDALGGALPQTPSGPAEVLALLDDVGSPATVASTGGRYFGFVTGGTVPAALAANWLAGAWDQNSAFSVMSPVAAKIEEIVLGWILELLGLPAACGAGFVTGTTTANFSALAAARTALLKRAGWNVEETLGLQVLRVRVAGGPARARNHGARAATGDILLFIDSDVAVRADIVGKITAIFTGEPHLTAVIGSYYDEPGAARFLFSY